MFARFWAVVILLMVGASAPIAAKPAPAPDPAAWAAQCKDWDDWDKAGPPFRVFGKTYYVGTCGISAILIDDPEGAIVIDGGPGNAGALVARNIEALGFKLSHVKVLLHSHEHNDHAGGLAELQRLTGAFLLASEAAAPVLASGEPSEGDPQFAGHSTFPAAKVDGMVSDGEAVQSGGLTLTAIATPGHTPGAMSWTWKSCDANICKTIVYADSLTPVSSDNYRFSDHPDYLAAFRNSFARIAALDCDILLSPHPSASGMRDKLLKSDLAGAPRCADYAARLGKQLDERLAKEAAQ